MGTVQTTDLTEAKIPNTSRATGSILDDLLAEPDAVETEVIDIPVPKRPGWVVRFDDQLSGRDLRSYKRAASKGKRGDVDSTVMNALILVDRNVAILRKQSDGSLEIVKDNDGENLTFTSIEFLEKFGNKGAQLDSVVSARKFLGEAFLVMAGNRVTEFAGWGDDVEGETPEDPTRG